MSRAIGGSPDKSYGLRARAWWVMRERRKFTLDMLLETVASGAEKDARSNLTKYLGHLERAGVLARSKHRLPGDSLTSPGYVVWIWPATWADTPPCGAAPRKPCGTPTPSAWWCPSLLPNPPPRRPSHEHRHAQQRHRGVALH